MAAPAECRPDHDTLLALVQGEERLRYRGKLKIFLGISLVLERHTRCSKPHTSAKPEESK